MFSKVRGGGRGVGDGVGVIFIKDSNSFEAYLDLYINYNQSLLTSSLEKELKELVMEISEEGKR